LEKLKKKKRKKMSSIEGILKLFVLGIGVAMLSQIYWDVDCPVTTYKTEYINIETSELKTYEDGPNLLGFYLWKNKYAQVSVKNLDTITSEIGINFKYSNGDRYQTDTVKQIVEPGETKVFTSKIPAGMKVMGYDPIIPTKQIPVVVTGKCKKSTLDFLFEFLSRAPRV
jgi:hypothetical protein